MIRELAAPCWVLNDTHWEDEDEALDAIRETAPDATLDLLAAPCSVVECDRCREDGEGEGAFLSLDGEGQGVTHFPSMADARRNAAEAGFAVVGADGYVVCDRDHLPEGEAPS